MRTQTHVVFRNGRAYYRRRVPQDLVEALRDRFSQGEVKIALGTSDRKEAAGLGRLRGVEVDRLFEDTRRSLNASPSPTTGFPSPTPSTNTRHNPPSDAALEDLARDLAETRLAGYEEQVMTPGFQPRRMERALDAGTDLWRLGMTEGVWSRQANDAVSNLLHANGYDVERGSEAFARARRLIARAMLAADIAGTKRALGDDTFAFDDPLLEERAGGRKGKGGGGPRLSEVFNRYLAERRLPERTAKEWRVSFRYLYELVGDKPVRSYSRDDMRGFKDTLLRIPASMTQRYPNKSVKEVLREVGDDRGVRRLARGTVTKYLTGINAVFSWAEANGYVEVNPASKIKVAGAEEAGNERLPYSTEDLNTIFSSAVFTKRYRPAAGRGEAAYWLPLLALYTGARQAEIGQLRVTDVRNEGGIHYLDFNTIEEGKKLKNKGSRRTVPLHPELIRRGFLEYVKGQRETGKPHLFPLLDVDRENPTKAWSQWWRRYTRGALKITDHRKVFHSFRHNFKDACRAAGISEEVHDALTGHTNGGVGRRYGLGVPLKVLDEAVKRIDYGGFSSQER